MKNNNENKPAHGPLSASLLINDVFIAETSDHNLMKAIIATAMNPGRIQQVTIILESGCFEMETKSPTLMDCQKIASRLSTVMMEQQGGIAKRHNINR